MRLLFFFLSQYWKTSQGLVIMSNDKYKNHSSQVSIFANDSEQENFAAISFSENLCSWENQAVS